MSAQSLLPAEASSEEQTTPWFAFRSTSLQEAYKEYRVKDVSYRVLAFAMTFGTILQIYFATQASSAQHYYLMCVSRALRVGIIFPGWCYCYRIYRHHHFDQFGSYLWRVRTSTLANVCIISFIASLCYFLILRTAIGSCVDDESSMNCNPEADNRALPQDAVISIMIVLVAVQPIIKCHDWYVLASLWFVSLVSFLVSVVISNATRSVFTLPLCLMVGAIIMEYEKNMFNTFIALRNMEQSIRTQLHTENERRVAEMQSVEMRHLLGNVAHDLKTPMQSFVMELELVSKMIKRPASQTAELISYVAHDVQQMISSLHNLTDTNSFMYMVINRAIDFAKSSSDRSLSPNLETINVTKTIQWAIDVVKSRCSVPVLLEPLSGDIYPHIITDKQWLIENILCLISNAAKFTTTGSVTVRCELIRSGIDLRIDCVNEDTKNNDTNNSSFCSGDELLIEVEDTGIGIPEEKRESMFRPFQQTMRMAGGTGLGLYSLRNRVDALKGSCGISDRRDGADGARIWFKIPYRPDEMAVCDECDTEIGATSTEIAVSSVEMIALSGMFSPRAINTEILATCNILLADDSLTIRKSISRVLMNEGLSVDLAENGQMALEMMGLKRYDLVLMDLQMPVMDGLEAVRRLRKQESESGGEYHQKVIGISAYAGEPYCSDAINAGMDGFIEKPFSAKRFLEVCEQHEVCGKVVID